MIALILSLFLLLASPVQAVTATPSATPTESSPEENIQEKIKNLVRENLATTEAKMKEKIDQNALLGFTGSITEIKNNNISLNTADGPIEAVISDKTNIVNGKGAAVKVSSLAIKQYILVIGTSIKKDILEAKRIIATTEPEPTIKEVFIDQIKSVDIKSKTVSFTSGRPDHILGKKVVGKIDTLKEGQTLIVVSRTIDSKQYISQFKIK